MSRQARRRRMRIIRRKIGAVFLPATAPSFLKLLSRTWKVEHVGEEHLERARESAGMLATIWHGRMLLAMPAYRDQEITILVSPSDDGSLVTTLLQRFGYQTIRGSSNKNPARAIREMLTELRQGGTIVITPDGPRGPRHSVNPGPAWMSRATGFPVMPCGFVADEAWRSKSWDRFTIPKRGARVVLTYCEPIYVAPDASDAEIESATAEIRTRMMAAEEEGFRRLGMEPDW